MEALPLRDELPYRLLERSMIRLAAAKRELESCRAELDRIMESMREQGLIVRLSSEADAEADPIPLMAVE